MRLEQAGAHAIGIDASKEMLSIACHDYPALEFKQADALDFTVSKPADALFSNAVFHWIDKEKQPLLLRQVNRALKLHGQFVCEFGGKGCAAMVHDSLKKSFEKRGLDYAFSFYFPSIGEYAGMLEQTGFKVVYAILFDRPTCCRNGENGLANWIRMLDKTPFRQIDAGLQKEIIAETELHLRNTRLYRNGEWYIDYVRIRIKAIKEMNL